MSDINEGLVDMITGMYGHDGYSAETTASILGIDTSVVEEIVRVFCIEQGGH